MGVVLGCPQPRRALCLFGEDTHPLFVRWNPAALNTRFARRQTLSTLDDDDQHWDERIETDTKLVVVHNATPAQLLRSRHTVERILERARVVVLFRETNAPPAFEAGAGANCFHIVTPSDIGLGKGQPKMAIDTVAASGSRRVAAIGELVGMGIKHETLLRCLGH